MCWLESSSLLWGILSVRMRSVANWVVVFGLPPYPCHTCNFYNTTDNSINVDVHGSVRLTVIINDKRSLDCALLCCKAHREWLEHERSVRETMKLKIGPILFSRGFKQRIFSIPI